MTLSLTLLGTPVVAADGATVEFDTRKALALLAYLAVTAQPQSRDTLAALLWPEYDAEHARSALRRTLSTVRRGLNDRWLVPGRQAVDVENDGLEVDVTRFRELITERHRDALEQAAALYRGDFLAGFALRDSIEFDDWQLSQADQLRGELAGALDRLSRLLAEEGEPLRAIDAARRRLALDPLSEPAQRWLIELHGRTGDRASAVRQYRDCVRVLDEELGVPPLRETTELYEAVTAGGLPPLPDAAARRRVTAQTPRTPGTLPLVGREAEVAALRDGYEQVEQTGDGLVIAIEGEPGIGKTRLADELTQLAAGRGAPVLAVRCHEGEQRLAYAPWSEALRQIVSSSPAPLAETVAPHLLAEAALLVPELRAIATDLPRPIEGPGAQARLFEAVAQAVSAALTNTLPGVLVLDDLQWADPATLDLLAYLSRRLAGRPICLVATRRPERIGESGPLDRLFDQLVERGAVLVRPSRLERAEIDRLMAAAGAPRALAQRLSDETEGVPYFVVEYLAALVAADEATSGSVPVPRGVRSLLRSRVASASEPAQQVLSAASVIGRSFDADLVRETSGREEEETISGLEELAGRGLVREAGATGEGTVLYDFTHDQLRKTVYEETSLPRRRLLHRRAAEALTGGRRQRRGEPAAALVAAHFQAAGQDRLAAEWFRRAGEESRRLRANDEALSQYRSALALGADNPAALHEAIADLETLMGRYEAALADYEAAAASAPPDRAARLEHKLGVLHHRRGAWTLAQPHLEGALALTSEADTAARARIVIDQGLNAHRRGNHRQAVERARAARRLAEAAEDRIALAQVHNLLGMLASGAGQRRAALRHLGESLRLADELGNETARVAALNNLALAERRAGNLERAVELTRDALDACARLGDRHREAALHNNLADLLHRIGEHEQAMGELKSAVSIFAEIGQAIQPDELQPEIWKLVEW